MQNGCSIVASFSHSDPVFNKVVWKRTSYNQMTTNEMDSTLFHLLKKKYKQRSWKQRNNDPVADFTLSGTRRGRKSHDGRQKGVGLKLLCLAGQRTLTRMKHKSVLNIILRNKIVPQDTRGLVLFSFFRHGNETADSICPKAGQH